MTTLLAIDPGPSRSYWALVEVGARPRYVDSGWCESTLEDVDRLFRSREVDHIALEQVAGYAYEAKRTAQLIATSRVEGMIGAGAYSFRVPLVEVAASTWRKALCGKGNADGHAIARALATWVVGMPTRTNEHVRDALGLAVVACRPLVAEAQAARRRRA
jgi:Holliday junction resolvasome RuvABC endonuclease subunit